MKLKTNLIKQEKFHFGDVVEHVSNRITPKSADSATYIGLEHMESDIDQVRTWGTDIVLIGTKLKIEQGDILLARRNPYLRRVQRSPHAGIFSAHGMVLRSKSEKLHQEYLLRFMQSELFWNGLDRIAVGSLSKTINWGDISKYEFTLPPIEQQKRVAEVFLKIENHLNNLYEIQIQMSNSLQLSRSIRYKASNLVPIETLATVQRGVSWSASQQVKGDNGTPILGIPNVRHGYIDHSNTTRITGVKESVLDAARITGESILMVGSNGNPERIGNVAICHEKVFNHLPASFLLHIKGKNLMSAQFLFEMLMSDEIQRQISNVVEGSTGLKNLAITWIRKLKVPELSDKVDSIFMNEMLLSQKALFEIDSEIASMKSLRKQLQNDLFVGVK